MTPQRKLTLIGCCAAVIFTVRPCVILLFTSAFYCIVRKSSQNDYLTVHSFTVLSILLCLPLIIQLTVVVNSLS